MSAPRCSRSQPAMIAAPVAVPAVNLVSGTVLCAVSLAASAGPLMLQMPKMPNFKLPDVPKIDLPSMPKLPSLPGLPGKAKAKVEQKAEPVVKGAAKAASKAAVQVKSRVPTPSPTGVKPQVRAASGKVKTPFGSENAPSLSDIQGSRAPGTSLSSGPGWKRFPARRMPGANLEGFKKMASEVKPRF